MITPAPAAANLGPAAAATGTGSSSADSAALQPAGLAPLQAGTNQLQASAPAGSTQQLLLGEADGAPHPVTDQPGSTGAWLWLALVVGLVVGACIVVVRHRRHFRLTEPRP